MAIEHIDIPPGEVHAPHHWRVADAAAREALAVTVAELGMYCWQQDDDSQWLLTAASPAAWKPVGGTGASAAGALLTANCLSELAADPAAQEAAQANLGLGAADPLSYYILAKA